jgi:hypothetical protein
VVEGRSLASRFTRKEEGTRCTDAKLASKLKVLVCSPIRDLASVFDDGRGDGGASKSAAGADSLLLHTVVSGMPASPRS